MGYDGTKARALNSTTNGTLQVAIVMIQIVVVQEQHLLSQIVLSVLSEI